MKNLLRAYPLITIDPYFSYWSTSNYLNKQDTKHWTGKVTKINGIVLIDGVTYCFIGKGKNPLKQTKRTVSPLITSYEFTNEKIKLVVEFWSPAFLDQPELFSRPCSYIDIRTEIQDNKKHEISITLDFDESFTYNDKKDASIFGDTLKNEVLSISYMGKRKQPLLESSGDNLRINWGYLLLASPKDNTKTEHLSENGRSFLRTSIKPINNKTTTVIVSYDDVASVNYFGNILVGAWKRRYNTIIDAIVDSSKDHDSNLVKAINLNKKLLDNAYKSGDSPLQTIVTASYRQSVAAHKACYDENSNLLFISKENSSNGCAATADISYPSMPLYLIYNPELVLGMVRPIIKNARCQMWTFDFAPHDAGRYPILNGNVYGMNDQYKKDKSPGNPAQIVNNNESHPPYYYYRNDESIYYFNAQMPVEECGNMIIMSYVASRKLNNKKFILDNIDLFEKWVKYLEKFGQDPEEQLCTDDFAGHLVHNANLAAKSICGIEAYALMNKFIGRKETYIQYHNKAKLYAKNWEKQADRFDHTCLAFDKQEGWSLKYNLVWDIYFKSNLFSKKLFQKEMDWYLKQNNKYGTPLDSRETYTKSDWEVWITCFTTDINKRKIIYKGIENFITSSKDRVPFGDWYKTDSGRNVGFYARSVQGGCFATILFDLKK